MAEQEQRSLEDNLANEELQENCSRRITGIKFSRTPNGTIEREEVSYQHHPLKIDDAGEYAAQNLIDLHRARNVLNNYVPRGYSK